MNQKLAVRYGTPEATWKIHGIIARIRIKRKVELKEGK